MRFILTAIVVIITFHILPPSVARAVAIADGPIRGAIQADHHSISLPVQIMDIIELSPGKAGYDMTLKGFFTGGKSGEPALPHYIFTFLVPPDIVTESVSATIAGEQWEIIDGYYDIAHVPYPRKQQQTNRTDPYRGRNEMLYQADAWFPASPIVHVTQSVYRTWRLVRVDFGPLAYNPVTQSLRKLVTADIIITYERHAFDAQDTRQQKPPSSRSDIFWKRLQPHLENPFQRESFYPAYRKSSFAVSSDHENANYVIITTESIREQSSILDAFAAHKESLGFTVAVITDGEDDDDGHYIGGILNSQRAVNIRQWLKNRYLSWGIEYVLLIGNPSTSGFVSENSLPMRMCYPSEDDICPTDMYYAELSSDWNYDDDTRFGEWNDDFGSGGIDQDCEVAVGRIPCYGNIEECDHILQKIITYETSPGDQSWRNKILIGAAVSNHAPQDGNGDGDACDNVSDEYPSASWRTFGNNWGRALQSMASSCELNTYTLFEKEGVYSDGRAYPLSLCDSPLSRSAFVSEWQNHYGFVTWWGHGDRTGVYRRVWADDDYDPPGTPTSYDGITQYPEEIFHERFFYTADCAMLHDDYPSFVVQIACSNGYPEYSTNLGYALLLDGAIGTVSSTRSCYYSVGSWNTGKGPGYGDNASYAYYLYQRMIEDHDTIGNALNYCRSSFTMGWGDASWYNMAVFNLYGDPSSGHFISGEDSLLTTYYIPYCKFDTHTWTGLALRNLSGDSDAAINATVYNSNGASIETVQTVLPANGQSSFAVGQSLSGNGWICVESDQPLGGLCLVGDVSMNNLIFDVALTDTLSPLLCIPHVAQNETWDTTLMICNPHDIPVTFEVTFYGQQGNIVSTTSLDLPARGSGVFSVETTVGTGPGSITIDARDSGTTGLSAIALFTNSDKVENGLAKAGLSAVAITSD